MKVTFWGTGTSSGVPVINCECKCCKSKNPHDTRFRSSIKIESSDDTTVVVDTGPEFRLQALKYGLKKLDCLFITHSHADHIHGLDDVRTFAHVFAEPEKCTKPLDIYSSSKVLRDIKNRFDYVFKVTQSGGGKPSLNLIESDFFSEKNPIIVGNLKVIPVPMMHGNQNSTGWIFFEIDENLNQKGKSFAYLTDCSFIPSSSIEKIKNCDIVVIDALRKKEHSTHFNYSKAIENAIKTKSKEIYFIHISHDETEEEIFEIIEELKKEFSIPKDVMIKPSFDGMLLEF